MNVGGVGRKFECPIGLTVDAHRTCLAAISTVSLWFRALRTDDAARLERMFCEAGQKHAAWEKRFGGDEVAWVTTLKRRVIGVLFDAASNELSEIKNGINAGELQAAVKRGIVNQCT